MHKISKAMAVAMVAASLLVQGCLWITSSAISSAPAKTGSQITASVSDMGYLMLVAPQGITQRASQQLLNQCMSGKVGDVQTELSMRNFFGLVQLYQVDVAALCQ